MNAKQEQTSLQSDANIARPRVGWWLWVAPSNVHFVFVLKKNRKKTSYQQSTKAMQTVSTFDWMVASKSESSVGNENREIIICAVIYFFFQAKPSVTINEGRRTTTGHLDQVGGGGWWRLVKWKVLISSFSFACIGMVNNFSVVFAQRNCSSGDVCLSRSEMTDCAEMVLFFFYFCMIASHEFWQ